MSASLTRTKQTTPVDAFIGSQIKRLRKERRISQETLGRHLGITFQQVQKYEKGTNRVGGSRLYKIAEYFDVAVGCFFPSAPAGRDGRQVDSVAGLELMRLFNEISDQRTRELILEFVRTLSSKSAP